LKIKEDIIAYLNDINIPADNITLSQIADRIIAKKTRARLFDNFKCFAMATPICKISVSCR